MSSNTSEVGNTLKYLTECSTSAINSISSNDSKYFALLKEKEKLGYHLLERDTELFKKKTELSSLMSIQKEKESQLNLLKQHSLQYTNKQIEETVFFSQNPPLFAFEPQKAEDNIKLQLSNGITLTVSKNPNSHNSLSSGLNCLSFSNKANPVQADNLDALYKEDPEAALLYLAYNL